MKEDKIFEDKEWPMFVDEDGAHVINDKETAEAMRKDMSEDDDLHSHNEEIEAAEEVEEIDDAISHDHDFDVIVMGSDVKLANAVANEINGAGLKVNLLDDHSDLKSWHGGKAIINCGDGWDAFLKALEVSEPSMKAVIQFGTSMHSGAGTGFATGAEIIIYDLDESKQDVAKKIHSRLS
jgi:hypothetical protein